MSQKPSSSAFLALGLLLTACGGESAETPCISNDECTGGLICIRGNCLDGCNETRDCGFGEICVGNACVEDVSSGGGDGFAWQATAFGPCGTTCGSSERTREVRCVDSSDGGEVDSSNCADPAPSTVESCVSDDECAWVATDWSDCSVTCGSDPGVETRTVRCEDTEGGPVDVELCASKGEQPAVMRDCTPTSACSWLTGGWSDCSVACGDGIETRAVTCIDASSDPVPDARCDAAAKPPTTQSCSEVCDWVTGAFGICDETCGDGTQTRTVSCRNSSGVPVDSSNCAGPQPPSTQTCFDNSDCRWFTGDWGACDEVCENRIGSQTRLVECQDETAATVTEMWCVDPAPADTQSCSGDQPAGTWTVGNFGPCQGFDDICRRSRIVTCDSPGCCPSPMPARFEDCDPSQCSCDFDCPIP